MICPQCKQPIDGLHTKTYGVGWCQLDVHLDCFPLHARSCQPCRTHNAEYVAAQSPK